MRHLRGLLSVMQPAFSFILVSCPPSPFSPHSLFWAGSLCTDPALAGPPELSSPPRVPQAEAVLPVLISSELYRTLFLDPCHILAWIRVIIALCLPVDSGLLWHCMSLQLHVELCHTLEVAVHTPECCWLHVCWRKELPFALSHFFYPLRGPYRDLLVSFFWRLSWLPWISCLASAGSSKKRWVVLVFYHQIRCLKFQEK